jgi:hypothetical protein
MSQRQCLPVDDDDSPMSDEEFDLSKMSAIDYLKQVRFERRKIPQIVTVHPMRSSESSSTFDRPETVREYFYKRFNINL